MIIIFGMSVSIKESISPDFLKKLTDYFIRVAKYQK